MVWRPLSAPKARRSAPTPVAARSLARPWRPARSGVRLLVAAVLGVLVVVSGARPAAAHAELSSTNPASGSVVATSPTTVTLEFTEAVSVEADGVRVLDTGAERRDAGDTSATGSTVTVPLEGTLPDGGYVVAWRVVSADGHPITGAFQFSVGTRTQVDQGIVDQAFSASGDRWDEIAGNVLRAIAYLSALVAAGATFVGARLRRPTDPSPVNRAITALAGLGVVALLVQVPVQTSRMTGRGWGSVTEAGVLGRALGDGFGWSIGITGLGLVLIAITGGLPFRGAVRTIALIGSVLAPIGFVLFGHTRTMSPAAVAYGADLVHLAAAAVWFGGLVALLVVLARRRRADDVAGAGGAVAEFSGLAGVVLGLVALTGGILGWIEVGSLKALTSTDYGRLLMVKVALVGVAVLGGTWNRFRLVPHLAAAGDGAPADADADAPAETDGDHDDAGEVVGVEVVDHDDAGPVAAVTADDPRWGTLSKILRLEVAVLVAVVGFTGILVNETPARQDVDQIITVNADFGEGSVEAWVDPGTPGRNDIHAIIVGADGAPADFEEVGFALALPAQDVGPLNLEPVRIGPGHYQLVGADLTISGEWTLTVTARPDRFTQTDATVSFTID